ncbi:MAG TPA: GMC family oxidoreductase [Streptosporangiaceae bacterium]|jgi:choline dehydrogenase|nr:GMC family oxidoreductase [Streptosporangiaceae bacterium]
MPSQDPADFDSLLAGTRAVLDIARGEPLAGFLDTPYLPDVASPDDEVLAAHVRRWTQTMYHPAGTCAMGTGERAVVDPQLRVRGIEGLRVIDASLTAWQHERANHHDRRKGVRPVAQPGSSIIKVGT